MKKQYISKHAAWIFTCGILSLLCFNLVFAQTSPDDFITITSKNVDQLELGYILPGTCAHYQDNIIEIAPIGIYDLFTGQKHFNAEGYVDQFSLDGKYIWYVDGTLLNTQSGDRMSIKPGSFSDDSRYVSAEDGVYKLDSKTKLFSTPTWGYFSHDGQYVAIYRDALYDVKTGKKRYILPPGIVEFSPDSKYFGVSNYGIYEVATGKQVIASSGLNPTFSPGSRYVEIVADGVYDLTTQNRLIMTTSSSNASFSADSSLVAISNDGLYELPSAKHRFKIGGEPYIPPFFLADSLFLVVNNDGVYDLKTNQKQYPIGYLSSISKSRRLIITDEAGIIETATGKSKFRIAGGHFASNENFILKTLQTDTDNRCLVFGIKGDKWPYRSGLVDTSHIQLYDAPNGEKRLDTQGRPLTTSKQQAVFAQTPDKEWLRVSDGTWVKAADVKPISLPDGIPTENP